MSLLAIATHHVLDVAFASYTGKGTGERALVRAILERLKRPFCQGLLFPRSSRGQALMDAGLYAFDILWTIHHKDAHFLVKVPSNVKPKRRRRLEDGSWLAQITQKVVHTTTPSGRQRWTTRLLDVRIICVQIPGFRPFWLMTNLLDPAITARALAIHYHQRWDVEIAYDEIKTHQCATLRGQLPTTFRSRKPQLIKQELYAMLTMYNAIRQLICLAVAPQEQDPREISFLQVLQHLIDATPSMSTQNRDEHAEP